MHERSRRYRHVDAAVIRAAAHPGYLHLPPWPGDDAASEHAWLARVWAQPSIAEAVAVASPAFADRVDAVCAGHRPNAGQTRRMVLALARYLVRIRGRATPFGIFAGVAAVRFDETVSALWPANHEARTRADAAWLAAVIGRLEMRPELRRLLLVEVNDLAIVRGDRLVVGWQPHASDMSDGPAPEVSVRYGTVVRAIIQAARSPILIGELTDKLAIELDAPASALDGMLCELVALGVLISSLRPPSTSGDGLAHVLDRLREVEAVEDGAFGTAAPLVAELRTIHALLLEGAGLDRREVRERMRAVADVVEQPVVTDLRLGGTVVLPSVVAQEAASAADALVRLAPAPGGRTSWQDYHARFLARYGAGALVRVEQLVDGVAGLGYPSHFADPDQPSTAGLSQRDQRLLALAQQAAIDGAREIALDDTALDRLAAGVDDVQTAPHVELCAEVRSPTLAALTGGVFTLAVIGTGRTGMARTGRFLNLLPSPDRQRMTDVYAGLPVSVDGALPAQLAFPPRTVHMQNVAHAPQFFPDVISLGEHRPAQLGRLRVQDLAVTADNDRLYLMSLSRRRVVEPVLPHAAALQAIPPLARLLFELPRARAVTISPFAWGVAKHLPFLPRLRYGRTVLTPARWRLPDGYLPGPEAPFTAWAAAMTELRERLGLPASVHVGEADRRLRLDLDEPMGMALLRAHLETAGPAATVAEAPTTADHGWLEGHAHEIVFPLAATTPPAPAPAVLTRSGRLSLIEPEHDELPGSNLLSAKLYAPLEAHDALLLGHLPDLLAAWGKKPPPWWFIRYRDPAPHLRLRLHLPRPDDYGTAACRVGAWAAALRRQGLIGDLILDTYHPETARYGSGPALQAAQELFVADSAAALAQLRAVAASRAIHPQALTAASMIHLVTAMTGTRPAAMRWLIDHPRPAPASPCDRTVLRQAIGLADPDGSMLRGMPAGPSIAAAWQARTAAAYADHLAATHLDSASVLVSLLHLHHIRVLGIDPESERMCLRLARAIALAVAAPRQKRSRG
ncbi:lantibiotic dehydratase [Nonomuraea fuscirosea]|uniref:lantibiotic dehydratase n=1 Tax=Nonomuraea fuscirosea TaxID=1291556 RepID=UPI0037BC4FF4